MKRITTTLALLLLLPTLVSAEDNILTTAAANGSFKTLTSLVVAANLDEALQSKDELTVFAPTDEAFAKLPKGTLENLLKSENRETLANILKYHVLPTEISVPKRNSHPLKSAKTLLGKKVNFDRKGSEVRINGAKIITRNIKCSNGLIHVIDTVLLPSEDDNTIVGTAKKAGNFKTLLAAAKAAGLVETLSSKGPLTVFAPTDKAFKALPKGTLASLLKSENKDQLATILKYHVVAGKITAQDAVKAGKAKTVAGQAVQVSIKDGQLLIDDAQVIANDLETSNGIIHVIDKVLLPASENHQTKTSAKQKKDSHAASSTPIFQKEVTITSDWDSPVTRDGIAADKITIRVGGAGRVKLTNVMATEIVTSIGGGGSVSIEGTVVEHNASVGGGAVLRAKDLVSKSTTVHVNGGGSAEVNATETLKASANGGAKLRYVDTGAEITKNINKYADFSKIR